MIKTLKRMFSTCGCKKQTRKRSNGKRSNGKRRNSRQYKRSGSKRTAKTYRGGYRLSSNKSRKSNK